MESSVHDNFLEGEGQARQNQIFLNDESHSQGAMGEEERKSGEAAVAHRLQKLSCAEKKSRHSPKYDL
ncbi:hypothetical protein NEPTK9_000875 [Candidatus Neptunochlamydia vexilliferae]|uniref:Uncharacterized protein n=1 Tax=Candidatus Neptunichlamydia vexilliferae TaxID=1651774 RepID=A0ABS0AZ09_9BACT|nr:hypothetical protein [Candidatus Neptunochlamydia vexilliferae]